MKPFNCLKVFGGESFLIASVFIINGVVLSLFIVYPTHSTCLQANLLLSNDMARFSRFRIVCSFCLCISIDPLVTISMSSKYAYGFE